MRRPTWLPQQWKSRPGLLECSFRQEFESSSEAKQETAWEQSLTAPREKEGTDQLNVETREELWKPGFAETVAGMLT